MATFVKTTANEYIVLDVDNNLKNVGEYKIEEGFSGGTNINLTIPYSICKYLNNSVTFFPNHRGLQHLRKLLINIIMVINLSSI